MLQFNRADLRVAWLRQQFPQAKLIHLYRHPRDQWLSVFVVSSVGKIRIGPVMWEILPFLAWALVVLGLTIVFPPITTWLPGQLR